MLLASREIRRAPVRFGLLSAAVGLLDILVFFQQTLMSSLLTSFTGALQNQSGFRAGVQLRSSKEPRSEAC